jgi:hypothetical protein
LVLQTRNSHRTRVKARARGSSCCLDACLDADCNDQEHQECQEHKEHQEHQECQEHKEHKEHQEHQEHQECQERREDGLKQDEDEANSHEEEVPSTERILVLGVESSDLNSLLILLLLLQHYS